MKISIITATYNSSATIGDCIRSVNEQTFPDIEHIIIDGKSNDSTIEIIKAISTRGIKIITESDKGIYDALNKGIQLATGDIIGFLHSDDMFASPQTLQKIADAFISPTTSSFNSIMGNEPKPIDVIYGDLVYIDKQDINKVLRYWKSQPFKTKLLKHGWMPAHPTIFMRREVYNKHGWFNTSFKCAADYDYILRVFSDQTQVIGYLPEVITKMTIGGVSTHGFRNIINKKKEDYLILKNNKMPFPFWILFVKSVSKIPQLLFKKPNISGK
jgi:glycosyltransferase